MMSDDLTQRFIKREAEKRYNRIVDYAKKHKDYNQIRRVIWYAESYLYGIGEALVEVGCLGYNENDYAVAELRKLLKYDDVLLEYGFLEEL